jgi:hypothetical protein
MFEWLSCFADAATPQLLTLPSNHLDVGSPQATTPNNRALPLLLTQQ